MRERLCERDRECDCVRERRIRERKGMVNVRWELIT
jgi:hypothetical protein